MTKSEIKKALACASVEDLKAELDYRKMLERARKYLPASERTLKRVKEKHEAYLRVLKEDEARRGKD